MMATWVFMSVIHCADRMGRMSSASAATSDPQAMIAATAGRPRPAWNSRPPTNGPSAAPPRPTPMTNPVPPARIAVGKALATIA